MFLEDSIAGGVDEKTKNELFITSVILSWAEADIIFTFEHFLIIIDPWHGAINIEQSVHSWMETEDE